MPLKQIIIIATLLLSACVAPNKPLDEPKAKIYLNEQQARAIVEDYLAMNDLDWGIPISVTTSPEEFHFLFQVRNNTDDSFVQESLTVDRDSGRIGSYYPDLSNLKDVIP